MKQIIFLLLFAVVQLAGFTQPPKQLTAYHRDQAAVKDATPTTINYLGVRHANGALYDRYARQMIKKITAQSNGSPMFILEGDWFMHEPTDTAHVRLLNLNAPGIPNDALAVWADCRLQKDSCQTLTDDLYPHLNLVVPSTNFDFDVNMVGLAQATIGCTNQNEVTINRTQAQCFFEFWRFELYTAWLAEYYADLGFEVYVIMGAEHALKNAIYQTSASKYSCSYFHLVDEQYDLPFNDVIERVLASRYVDQQLNWSIFNFTQLQMGPNQLPDRYQQAVVDQLTNLLQYTTASKDVADALQINKGDLLIGLYQSDETLGNHLRHGDKVEVTVVDDLGSTSVQTVTFLTITTVRHITFAGRNGVPVSTHLGVTFPLAYKVLLFTGPEEFKERTTEIKLSR